MAGAPSGSIYIGVARRVAILGLRLGYRALTKVATHRLGYANAIAWAGSIVTLALLRNLAIEFSTSTFELDEPEPATVCSTLISYYIQHGVGSE